MIIKSNCQIMLTVRIVGCNIFFSRVDEINWKKIDHIGSASWLFNVDRMIGKNSKSTEISSSWKILEMLMYVYFSFNVLRINSRIGNKFITNSVCKYLQRVLLSQNTYTHFIWHYVKDLMWHNHIIYKLTT